MAERNATHSVTAESAILAVTSLAAAAIHFGVMADHFAEYSAFGVFFAAAAWFQSIWAVGIVVTKSRWLPWAGVVGNALIVIVWVVSRTTGLPVGPDAGVPEAAELADVLATILELALIAGSGLLIVQEPSVELTGRTVIAIVVGLTAGLAALTTFALVRSDHTGGSDHGGSDGASVEHGGESTLGARDDPVLSYGGVI